MLLQQVAAIGGLVLFFALSIYFVIRQKAAIRAAFEGFAKQHGLAFTPGSFPSAIGKVDGRYTVVRSRFEPRQRIAFFQVQVGVGGEPPRGMLVYGRGLLDGKGLKTGDTELDANVHIDAPDPAAVTAYLNPTRRAALIKLAAAKHAFAVPAEANETGPVVILDQAGFKPRVEWLEEKYKQVLELARQLE